MREGYPNLHAKSHRAALLTISGVAALNKPIAVAVIAGGESCGGDNQHLRQENRNGSTCDTLLPTAAAIFNLVRMQAITWQVSACSR